MPCPAHCVSLPADFSAASEHRDDAKTETSPCPSSKSWPSRPPRCHADRHARCHACRVRQLCPGHAPMTCSDCRSSELAGTCTVLPERAGQTQAGPGRRSLCPSRTPGHAFPPRPQRSIHNVTRRPASRPLSCSWTKARFGALTMRAIQWPSLPSLPDARRLRCPGVHRSSQSTAPPRSGYNTHERTHAWAQLALLAPRVRAPSRATCDSSASAICQNCETRRPEIAASRTRPIARRASWLCPRAITCQLARTCFRLQLPHYQICLFRPGASC